MTENDTNNVDSREWQDDELHRTERFQFRYVPQTDWIRDIVQDDRRKRKEPFTIVVLPDGDKPRRDSSRPIPSDRQFFLALASDSKDDLLTRYKPDDANLKEVLKRLFRFWTLRGV